MPLAYACLLLYKTFYYTTFKCIKKMHNHHMKQSLFQMNKYYILWIMYSSIVIILSFKQEHWITCINDIFEVFKIEFKIYMYIQHSETKLFLAMKLKLLRIYNQTKNILYWSKTKEVTINKLRYSYLVWVVRALSYKCQK